MARRDRHPVVVEMHLVINFGNLCIELAADEHQLLFEHLKKEKLVVLLVSHPALVVERPNPLLYLF